MKELVHLATNPMSTEVPEFSRLQRWRLLLGKGAEAELKKHGKPGRQEPTSGLLSQEQSEMDESLGAIYDRPPSGPRMAGLEAGKGTIAKWLGDVRKYFETDVVIGIQKDAIASNEKLKVLLLEPELLADVVPSVEMVGTLMSLKHLVPEKAKDAARQMVKSVVEEIQKRLKNAIERAIRGALDRSRHQPIPSLPNIDWNRTIRRNLKNYIPSRKIVIPERFHFWARQHRRRDFNVIVCMDQSGSMAESVVYGSVMGAIFASIPAIETHVIAFDTEVADLTHQCHDPVEMLFGIQLGGGTDIERAVHYCQKLIRDPAKTFFILITDLYEGGNEARLLQRMSEITDSGVRAICLLALSDSGVPAYNESLAKKLAAVNVPSFGCTPNILPEMLEALFKGQDVASVAAQFDTQKRTRG